MSRVRALLPRLTPLAAALSLAACSLAPRYEAPPPAATSAAYKEAAGDWRPARPADELPRGAWWQAFGDPQLDELETRLQASSQDLAAAVARYRQARALSTQARGNLLPRVDANASATRAGNSANAPGAAGQSGTGNDFAASLDLSWEIDVFGRLRNAASAADRRVQASAGDLAALDLSLQAQLASTYFQLRGADATLALLADNVEAFGRAAELTRNRYQGGIAAAADVDQAEAQLQDARAQMAATRLDRAQYEHAIAVLIGESPATFALAPGEFTVEPPVVATGLPSTILERRPDIAAAERRVAAANAEIGVANAAWFPVFSFGASGGYEATRASKWFDSPSQFWGIGPSLTAPILNPGLISGLKRQARAAYDESVADYRQSVLVAYQEVEDNLAALHHLADQVAANTAAAEASERAAFHARKRYSGGVADYLEVASTQTQALSARRSALDARVRRAVASVQLVRALGGGWTPAQLDDPLAPSAAPVAQAAP